jgi:hypothetical protein
LLEELEDNGKYSRILWLVEKFPGRLKMPLVSSKRSAKNTLEYSENYKRGGRGGYIP